MKIAVISFSCLDSTFPLVKSLSKNNEVDLYCITIKTQPNYFLLNIKNHLNRYGLLKKHEVEEILSPEIKSYVDNKFNISICIFNTMYWKDIKDYYCMIKLYLHIRNKYDVFHFIGHSPQIVLLSLLLHNRKRVFSLHEVYSHYGNTSFITRMIIKYIALSKVQIIVHSNTTKNRLNQLFPKRIIHMVRFGLYDFYKYYNCNKNILEENNSILFVGYINEYKGLEYLIEAYKKVKEINKNIKLTIAGYGDINKYAKISENDAIKNEIIIHNKIIENDFLVELIKKTKIIICPYTSASQSGVIMTAYTFGKPVIVTDVDGLKEVVKNGETGLVVKVRNYEEIAEAIICLLNNNKHYEKMKENILVSYSSGEYSWNYIMEKTLRIYTALN